MGNVFRTLIFVLVLTLLSLTVFAFENKIVSVTDNLINISSQELADCHGAICEYTFTVQNRDLNDKNVNIKNVFYSENAIPLALYKWQYVTEQKSQNNPYECNCVEDTINATNATVCSLCDNITYYDVTYQDWVEVSSDKNDAKLISSKDKPVLLAKQDVQKFKAKVFVPLGQNVKYDIITENEDKTTTTLDPWVNNTFYQIKVYNTLLVNLTAYYAAESSFDSLSSLNLTLINVTNQSGKIGNAYNFSNYGYAVIPSQINLSSNSFTINMWLKKSAYTGFKSLIHKNGGGNPTLQFNGDDLMYCPQTGCTNFAPNITITNQWYMFTLQKNSSNHILLYINGVFNTSVLGDSSPFYFDRIGIDTSNPGRNFDGLIDEFAAWNRTLSANEISTLYNNNNGLSYSRRSINNNSFDNLNISNNLTGVLIQYESNVLNLNDSALGNNLDNNQCYNIILGQTSLNWAVNTLNDTVINYSFTTCLATELDGLNAIVEGIASSHYAGGCTVYDNKTVYIRLANGSQYTGTFDKFMVLGNKRYAFNYDPNVTSNVTMYNITPVFYVWQNINMSTVAIRNSVQSLIDSTN